METLSDAFETALEDTATLEVLRSLGAEVNFRNAATFSEDLAVEFEIYKTVLYDVMGA